MSTGWGSQPWGLGPWGGGAALSGLSIQNVVPASGGSILSTDAIQFDVVSATTGLQVVLAAEYPNVTPADFIYDGTSLFSLYRNGQTMVTAIPGGFRFTLLRTGGWPDNQVSIRIYAYDDLGFELSEILTWAVTQPVIAVVALQEKASARLNPIGYGPVRPFRRAANGDVVTAEGVAYVLQKAGQVIGTIPGEVRWRPGLGTYLSTLRHRSNARAQADVGRVMIESALSRWVRQATVVDVQAEPVVLGGENRLALEVGLQIANAGVQRGLVVV